MKNSFTLVWYEGNILHAKEFENTDFEAEKTKLEDNPKVRFIQYQYREGTRLTDGKIRKFR